MSDALDTIEVDSPAGTYTINVHFDDDAENPLIEWDQTGMTFYVGNDQVNTLREAGRAGEVLEHWILEHGTTQGDEIVRRYEKWRAIAGSPWRLFIGSDSASRSDYYEWFVLVDMTDWTGENIDPPVESTMETYRAWAAGEVYGFTVDDPSGKSTDLSCFGFYGDDRNGYMIDEARDEIAYHAAQRVEKCHLVGAGFVGLV